MRRSLFLASRTDGRTDNFGSIRSHGTVDQWNMALTTENIALLSRLLSAATLRHDVIAQNVANVNTPGFQTLEVSFEDALQEAMAAGREGNAEAVLPQVILGAGGMERADGNNVDVDLEIARLQKNSLYFKVYTQLLAGELAQFRSAIAGR